MQIKLSHDIFTMTCHRFGADDQGFADFIVAFTFCKMDQYFLLTVGQVPSPETALCLLVR